MWRRVLPSVAAAVALAVSAPSAQPGPVVETPQGKLRGVTADGISSFKGIPYAAPPVGELRWREPSPPACWSGIRPADEYGSVCPQILRPGYSLEVLGSRPMAEDCLYLNVWTGSPDPAARRPVMVWLLPGAFQMGDASMPRYDGAALAAQGVVVVTFNYRLGMLGQFAHPALRRTRPEEPAGNYHVMDQLAALRWVRGSIAAFGGDPGNVTIFGMSAGGVSVNYLMTVPAAAGLFHRAISESSGIRVGRPRLLSETLPGLPSLEDEGTRIARDLGIEGDDADVVRRLRALTVEQVLAYQAEHVLGTGGSLNPVVDGRIVVRGVGDAFREGLQHQVPYLTGATTWEGSLLGWATSADPVLGALGITRDETRELYGELDDRQLNDALYADFFLGSQRHLAQLHASAVQPTFVYVFSRVLDRHRNELPGAAHGAEMRYVFKSLGSLRLLGGGPGAYGDDPDASDEAFADLVSAYWVQFAVSGDPNGTGRPGWPALSPGNDLLLELGQDDVTVHRDFRARRQSFWNSHFDAGEL